MADYWKSQPRKFCQYCKCWIADNKPSVEFHERGKNHKENVAAKISEIKKKSIDKAKQDERMSKQFAAMEEAAMKAYEEDLKRMEREAAGLSSPAQTTAQPLPPVKPVVVINKPRPQSKSQAKKLKKKEQARNKAREQARVQVWVEGHSDDGHVYYYNTITGESQWDKPEGFQRQASASGQLGQTESSSGSPWMEAVSPEGYTYYYNSETGESSWEKPADFPSNDPSGSTAEAESQEEDPSSPQPETPSGGEENSDTALVSQEVPEEASKESKVPKISFRKRKAEPEQPEKEGQDKVGDDAPKEVPAETKTEEDVQSTATDREEKEDEPKPREIQAKRPKTNPYGVWEKIQEEKDPYASVDLELPQVEASTAAAPTDLPPEPKPKFKERVITSLGEEGGPASFKRTKTQNSKSRSLRQRDNDD